MTDSSDKLPKKVEFYMYVGFCITAWAKVEEDLFDISQDLLGCSKEKAAIVYYRTPSMRARLELVDELMSTALPQRGRKNGGHDHPDLVAWTRIYSQVKQ